MKEVLCQQDSLNFHLDSLIYELDCMRVASLHEISKEIEDLNYYYDQLMKTGTLEQEICRDFHHFNEESKQFFEKSLR